MQHSETLVMLCFPHQESSFVRVDTRQGPMPRRGPSERFEGIDVELLERFASHLGVDLEIQTIEVPSYSALIPGLLEGKAHLIASSFSITAERLELVDFSTPYHVTYRQIISRKGLEVGSLEELTGLRAAVVEGTNHERFLRDLGVRDEQLVHVAFTLDVYNAVNDGDADYALVDHESVVRLLDEFENIEVAFRLEGEDRFGIAVRQGSDLLPVLNAWLEAMRAEGELDALIDAELRSQGTN